MADPDNMPSTTTVDPAGSVNTNEIVPPSDPSPGEIQEVAQRILASLTEEKRNQIRTAVMRSMNEEQRRQAAATMKDPLIQFVSHKARSDIMNGTASAEIGNGKQQHQQQQRQQQTINMSLGAPRRGLEAHTFLCAMMTQLPHDGINTTAAISPSRTAPGAYASLDSEHE
jgi:hypothetical protein